MAIRVTIPSFRKVKDVNDVSFTAFLINVYHGRQQYSLEKRYTDFEELHKQLKKKMKTPEFPPKKVLKWNHKVLEQRRQGLQAYVQGLLDGVPIPQTLLDFLGIDPHVVTSIGDLDNEEHVPRATHQPLIAFDGKAFLEETWKSSLPDLITDGVINGMYSSIYDELPK